MARREEMVVVKGREGRCEIKKRFVDIYIQILTAQ